MSEADKIIMAPCSNCVGKRRHKVLFETAQQEEETVEKYAMIECCGCGRISMGYQRVWKDDGTVDNDFFPSPVSRKEPDWVYWVWLGKWRSSAEQEAAKLMVLLREVYQAVHGSQYRLAAMGIRALLEQVTDEVFIGEDKGRNIVTRAAQVDEPQRVGNQELCYARSLSSVRTDFSHRRFGC